MKVEAMKVENGFLIPFNESLGQVKGDKLLLNIEVVEPDQFAEGYAYVDKLVGVCESSRTDASINQDDLFASISPPPGFTELSKAEQIHYLQVLWDQITDRPSEVPVKGSHLQLAEERLEQYRREPKNAHSAYEVLDRLAKKRS